MIMGELVSFDDIKPYSKEKYVRERKAKAADNPYLVDTEEDGADAAASFVSPSGLSLTNWHRKAKDRFLIADVIETYCDDKIRHAGGEKVGTVHIECPFEHEHSKSGGTATMAMNPDANKDEVWTVFCHHDSCQGRHKLEFLAEMLKEEWFPEDVLYDDTFMLPPEDGVEDSAIQAMRDGPIKDHSTKNIQAEIADAGIDQDSSESDIETFIQRCIDGDADGAVPGRVAAELAKITPFTKPELKKIWGRLKGADGLTPAQLNPDSTRLQIDTRGNYRANCDEIYEYLQDQGDSPTLFHSNGRLVDIQEDENYNLSIKGFEKDRFKAAILEDRVDFWQVSDKAATEVEAPSGIVKQRLS